MSDSHWEKVKDIFHAALEKPAGMERERFLRQACGGDADLQGEVLELLESFALADDFMDAPPISEVAETIVGKIENFSAGQQIGRYRIERKLGAGGMGEVYLARDLELERFVALKILSAAFSSNSERIRRFAQEARAASALNHPNILTIYEIGQFENLRFIATEYVAGETLRERQRRAPLDFGEILDVFAQTAAALGSAHEAGIVHRDVKPENIMIRPDGLVKVLDFGLAKIIKDESENFNAESQRRTQISTTPGLVLGTVAYMSPEQARGLKTDARTDVWSLGVCLYETVFGAQPFAGETVSDQIAAILKNEPEMQSDNAPPRLTAIIKKCLEKNAENRYQTIRDFARDIKNLVTESIVSAEINFPLVASNALGNGVADQSNGKETNNRAKISTETSVPPRASSAEYIVGEIKKHKKFLSLSASGAITIAVLALILYFSYFAASSRAKPINSLAVLSFANDGNGSDSEYLSDGLSETLISKLSKLPQLKVAARSSAFKYKGKDVDPREVARALNVEAIVAGRVARRGDDLQISVELVNATDNTLIWSESYRRKISDAQAIQDEIAQTIVQNLRLKLSGEQQELINSPLTANSQAYQLYLNGIFFRRKNGTENLKKAIEYQKQAIALDSEFALAYAELAVNYYNLVITGAIEQQTGARLARTAVEKALSLDDTLADAHNTNANLKSLEFDWTGAEAENRRALELNPNLAAAHASYAGKLAQKKQFDEALREIKRARELDPLRTGLVVNEGITLLHARRYDEAIALLERDDSDAASTSFSRITLARAYAAQNRYAEAIDTLQRTLDSEETASGLIHLGRVYALAGKREEALTILERFKKNAKDASPGESAMLYAALGDRDQAFALLEQGFAARDFQLAVLNIAPEYDVLREDSRFSDLLRRINLQ